MQLISKILFTLFFVCVLIFIIKWIWIQQIDLKETILRPFKVFSNKSTEWIATKDSDAIYQSGKIVGNISGNVKEVDDKVIFQEISNTAELNKVLPIEYKGLGLKIVNIDKSIGMYIDNGKVKNSVIQNVVCEKNK